MKRYIPLLIFLFALFGCKGNAPTPTESSCTTAATDPTIPQATAQTQPTEDTTIPTEDTTIPAETTQPYETTVPEETTIPVIAEFDPMQIIASMTLEEKVGQLFLARCPEEKAVDALQSYHLGGYILFGRDTQGQTKESLKETIDSYQAASRIPMLIAVDEEGGSVCRVSNVSTLRESRFLSPRKLYNRGGMELVLSTEEEKCLLLKELGFNVNMAPVCDVTTDPAAFMYSRSLGQSSAITGAFASDMCAVMAHHGIGSVLKHFPGYGNNTDTHTGIAIDIRSLEELESCDLIPFSMGIAGGCDAILVSHTIVQCLDPQLPASLSPAVHSYLRSEMGFNGVIITDDLVMEAITDLYGDAEAAVLAVQAGNDLLCVSNYADQYRAVLTAVEEGRIPMEQIDAAVGRILLWKYRIGLFSQDFSINYT